MLLSPPLLIPWLVGFCSLPNPLLLLDVFVGPLDDDSHPAIAAHRIATPTNRLTTLPLLLGTFADRLFQ
ncbi:MAG TPA: hypothetical protein VMR50_14905 [Myxococcota bacterium]|nr:hypothetical protein [Myxococcota bacterium]